MMNNLHRTRPNDKPQKSWKDSWTFTGLSAEDGQFNKPIEKNKKKIY